MLATAQSLKVQLRDKTNHEKHEPIIARWYIINCTAKLQVADVIWRLGTQMRAMRLRKSRPEE